MTVKENVCEEIKNKGEQYCKNCEFSVKHEGFLICKRFSYPALEGAICDISQDDKQEIPNSNFIVSPHFCCNRWLKKRERLYILEKEDK